MTRQTITQITATLTRLLYLLMAVALVVALLFTLDRLLPLALSSELASPARAANAHLAQPGTWETYTTANGLASNFVLSIAVDGQNVWFGTNSGVSVFDGETWTSYGTSDGLVNNIVKAIAIDLEGSKWFGTEGGVSKLDDGGTPHNKGDDTWTTYTASPGGLVFNKISAIAVDQAGNIWFGTKLAYAYGYGVSRFDGVSTWTTYNKSSGLGDNAINAIAADNSGNVWVGTVWGGVSKFDGNSWTTYKTSNSGLASNYVRSIAVDSAGVKWFGGCIGEEWSAGELFRCDAAAVSRFDGGWAQYIAPGGLTGYEVTAIGIDWRGHKWFGTKWYGVNEFDGASWMLYDTSNSGLESNTINAIAPDNEWNLWFATQGGGASRYELPVPTPTPTATSTPTDTPTPTITPTSTWTPTATPTNTPTTTATPTPTATSTSTATPTATPYRLYLPLILKAYPK